MSAAFDSTPPELRDINAWLNWRRERVDGEDQKVPILATALKQDRLVRAKVGNPKYWRPFKLALTNLQRDKRLNGIGFVLHPPFVGVDVDHCLDNGQPNELAQMALDMLPTYCDRSPNDGLKFIGRGEVPKGWRQRGGALEIYVSGRYFTLTGQTWPGHEEVAELPNLDKFIEAAEPMLPEPPANGGKLYRDMVFARDKIHRGQRDLTILSYIGWMRTRGRPKDRILAASLDYNRHRFVPPLPEKVIEDKVDYVFKKYSGGSR